MTKTFFGGVYTYAPSGIVKYNGRWGRFWERWFSTGSGEVLSGRVFCKRRTTRIGIVEAFNPED